MANIDSTATAVLAKGKKAALLQRLSENICWLAQR